MSWACDAPTHPLALERTQGQKRTLKPIDWDRKEMFTASNGKVGVRYAISDRDGVAYEFSMHDHTIQSMLPRSLWMPVFAAPSTNAKIDRIDGRLVVLCAMNKPQRPQWAT